MHIPNNMIFLWVVLYGVVVTATTLDMCRYKDCRNTSGELPTPFLFEKQSMMRPQSMNMITENHDPDSRSSLLLASITEKKSNLTATPTKVSRGRALDLTHLSDDFDLSDVTIKDEVEKIDEASSAKILVSHTKDAVHSHNSSTGTCQEGGLTYDNGEKLEIGCDSLCTCKNGTMVCDVRCIDPLFKRGRKIEDPLCFGKPVDDPCCSILVCTADTEKESLEVCTHDNRTYHRGDTFEKDCSQICTCESAGELSCKQRCSTQEKSSDRCVEIPDPDDKCCKKVLCDVALDDHQVVTTKPRKHKILYAIQTNSSVIHLDIDPPYTNDELPVVEVSNNKEDWSYYQLFPQGVLYVKSDFKYLRLEGTEEVVEVNQHTLEESMEKDRESKQKTNKAGKVEERNDIVKIDDGCKYKGKLFRNEEEYNDECKSLCVCYKGNMKCFELNCPTYFGVDVLDAGCVDWETIPPNFVASPPNCCPDKVRCKNNGSCLHENKLYKNWEQLPVNVTGCEKRCYCEMGVIECQNTCPPVTALPPPQLACSPTHANLQHTPDDDCCMYWVCVDSKTQDSFNNHYPKDWLSQPRDEITVRTLEAIDPHTIRLAFMVPSIIVGLHGRVEVRYTYKDSEDISNWDLQVFAPPKDLIATPSLEFDLLDLVPDKEYKIKIELSLRDLHNNPSSIIHKIRTPKEVMHTTLPPHIPIEPNLEISDINATWATMTWRKFTEYELQFIDGVQLRYKEVDENIDTATPLIHRAVTSYTIEGLKPNTKYTIGIFFIPFAGQLSELSSENMQQFTTANLIDTYGFNVTLRISSIKSSSAEITWEGVPYPEDKYVNIFRAIYQSDSGKEDHSTFKLPKRDFPTRTIIKDLKPGTRYRLWLEVYLTNGKIKTTDVHDFITKPRLGPALGASSQDKVTRAELADAPRGDYYGPLVIVAILATVAILSTLILLMILVKRHNQNKAAITPTSRASQSAYDNPTYKVEIQQETMGL